MFETCWTKEIYQTQTIKETRKIMKVVEVSVAEAEQDLLLSEERSH
jgi:hypothetical protein